MFRVAVIGYRVQGSRHHAPAFAKVPDCEIAAVCDIVEERAQQGASEYGVPAYTSIDDLLAREEFDIADIPVGERFRRDLVVKCLRAGKHVFTEKPLAASEGQFAIQPADVLVAREMVEEWERHEGLQFGVCFGLHASRNVAWARETIRSGILGPFAGMHAVVQHNSWNHLIDLVRFLGGRAVRVFAFADRGGGMDVKTAVLEFEDGGTATLASFRKLGLQFQVKWVGAVGEVVINNIAGDAYWNRHDSLETVAYSEERTVARCTYETLFDDLIADYVASIREGRPFIADGWAGLRHVEIDAAITESIRTDQPVAPASYRPEKGATVNDPVPAWG